MTAALEVVIDPEVLERFPETQVTAFSAAGLGRARQRLAASSEALVAEARAALERAFPSADAVVDDQRITGWRRAMRMCGLKAASVRSSAEQLARRLLRADGVTADDPLVQAYCAISAKHLAPIGVYDVERLPSPQVTLRTARPGDTFEPLGGKAKDMPLDPGVVVYGAGREVLCWAFNHRDSARTALQPETERALFNAEAVFAAQVPAMWAAMRELRELLAAHGAVVGELASATAAAPRAIVSAEVSRPA